MVSIVLLIRSLLHSQDSQVDLVLREFPLLSHCLLVFTFPSIPSHPKSPWQRRVQTYPKQLRNNITSSSYPSPPLFLRQKHRRVQTCPEWLCNIMTSSSYSSLSSILRGWMYPNMFCYVIVPLPLPLYI